MGARCAPAGRLPSSRLRPCWPLPPRRRPPTVSRPSGGRWPSAPP